MSAEKSELRSCAIHEVGCKLDDVLEAAKLDVARFDGAGEALTLAAGRLSVVYQEIDQETVPDGSLSLEEASMAKRYVTRCVDFLTKASEDAARGKFRAEGKVLGLEQSVVVAKSLYELEKSKADPPPREGRDEKGKPLPLKERRKSVLKKAKKVKRPKTP